MSAINVLKAEVRLVEFTAAEIPLFAYSKTNISLFGHVELLRNLGSTQTSSKLGCVKQAVLMLSDTPSTQSDARELILLLSDWSTLCDV